MKNALVNARNKISMLSLLLLSRIGAFAQDSSASANSTTTVTHSTTGPDTTQMWYTAPWVWIVGAVVLLLIIVAAVSGSNKRRTEVTRTTKTTTEVKND